MKICTGCKKELPDSEFWLKNKKTGTLVARCKDCIREAQRIRYHANPQKYRQRQRELSLKRRMAGEKSDFTLERKLQIQKSVNKFYKNHPNRQHVKSAVSEAAKRGERIIKDGKVSNRIKSPVFLKPPYCPMCGKRIPTHKLHGHHHNGYDKPLDVLFVCQNCHKAITVFEREAVQEGMPAVSGLAKFIKQQRDLSIKPTAQTTTIPFFQRIMKVIRIQKGDTYVS